MSNVQDHQSEPRRWARERFQFSMRGLLVFVGLFCAGCALVFSSVRAVREADRRARCKARHQSIGLAVCDYHDTSGSFPPPFFSDAAGKPLNSWRVLVGESLGDGALMRNGYRLRLPWNDSTNLKISGFYGWQFQCPARHPKVNGYTDYVMVLGETRASRAGAAPSVGAHHDQIIIVEIADSDVYWTEPRDLVLGELSIQINDESKPVSSDHAHRGRSATDDFVAGEKGDVLPY
jgi:hypothetical protein